MMVGCHGVAYFVVGLLSVCHPLSFVLESPEENQNWARDHQPLILSICFLSNFYLVLL